MTVDRSNEGLENLLLPLWRGKSNVNLMVNKKDTHELLNRVFDIETSAKDHGKEKAHQDKVEAAKQQINNATEASSTLKIQSKKLLRSNKKLMTNKWFVY